MNGIWGLILFQLLANSAYGLELSDFTKQYLKNNRAWRMAKYESLSLAAKANAQDSKYPSKLSLQGDISHFDRNFDGITGNQYNRVPHIIGSFEQGFPTGTSLELKSSNQLEEVPQQITNIRKASSAKLTQDLWGNSFGNADRKKAGAARAQFEKEKLNLIWKNIKACTSAIELYIKAFSIQKELGIITEKLRQSKKALNSSRKLYRQRLIPKIDLLSAEEDHISLQQQADHIGALHKNLVAEMNDQQTTEKKAGDRLIDPEKKLTAIPWETAGDFNIQERIHAKTKSAAELSADAATSETGTRVQLGFEVGRNEGHIATGSPTAVGFTEDFAKAILKISLPLNQSQANSLTKQAIANKNLGQLKYQDYLLKQRLTQKKLKNNQAFLKKQLESDTKKLTLLKEKARRAFDKMKIGKMEFETYLLHRNDLLNTQVRQVQNWKSFWLSKIHLYLNNASDHILPICEV